MNTWGNKIRLSIFGESHGNSIGIVIDGLPAGLKLNFPFIRKMLSRRKAGNEIFTSPRVEKDEFEILSGFYNEVTTGSPLCVIFKNTNTKEKDYSIIKDILRPSHADFPAKVKFKNFNDFRGGGHFSGRITLALTFAGAIAKSILKDKNINIFSHIKKVASFNDISFLDVKENFDHSKLEKTSLPFLDENLETGVRSFLEKVKLNGDSVGGKIECGIFNVPVGLGSPFFESLESKISQLAFSIPAVKAIEFGIGCEFCEKFGSNANDEYYIKNDKIQTSSNNNGGITGGLSNGMPIIFSLTVKPTPSIQIEQRSVNYETMEETKLNIQGRHDSFIVSRVLPVVEAIAALASYSGGRARRIA